VEDLAIYYNLHPPYQGEEILLGTMSTQVLLRRGGLESEDTPAKQLAAALLRGEIAVSHAFHHRFGIDVGDSVTLDTRKGPHTFRVGGFLRDYSGPAGSLHLDIATFDEHFTREGAHFLGLWASTPLSVVQDEIHRRHHGSQPLFLQYGERLRSTASTVLSRFEDLLNVLAALCASFSAVALLNLFNSGIATRRRELALMQSVGASPANIAAVILLDGVLVSAGGGLLGVFLGLAAGSAGTDLLFERFGWVVDYRVELGTVLSALIAVVAISVVVGLPPAWMARRNLPPTALTSE
jgi:predicted lysophospholipase L1 biosynthesis ABC-type transport system permease subunit